MVVTLGKSTREALRLAWLDVTITKYFKEVVRNHKLDASLNRRDGTMAQQLFTIECRVDFRDESKIPLFKTLIQQAARLVITQAGLLGDGVKPEVVIYSHDYFKGHQDIALFDDDISKGGLAITEAGNLLTDSAPASAPPEQEISPELIAALTK